MESFLHKELIVNVATMCEETLDDNDCMGSELYMMLYFDTKEVRISELEIDSCSKESINKVGVYSWKLTNNDLVIIESLPIKLPLIGVKALSLELKNKQLVGRFKLLNGKTKSLIFNKKLIN